MVAVGITSNIDRAEMAVIASDVHQIILVPWFTDLATLTPRLMDAACGTRVPVRQTFGANHLQLYVYKEKSICIWTLNILK